MDDRLKRIEAKTDSIADRLGSIDVTLAAQHESLKDHMRRTAALEAQVSPLTDHLNRAKGAISLLTVISVIMAILVGIFEVWGHLPK